MLIDASQLPAGSLIESDLIIIGGGLAGISIARWLLDSGIDVAVLESGGEERDADAQALYAGTARMVGPAGETRSIDEYLVESRIRAYGGSGNAWGGKCAPLRRVDLERRAWIPESGWPISREDLDPYYDRACDLLEMPRFDFDLAQPLQRSRPPILVEEGRNLTTVPRLHTAVTGRTGGPPWERFKASILNRPNTRVYLNANVVDIVARQDGSLIERLEVACLNGKRHEARGRAYVLATGGIENARLLLNSDGAHRNGLGNGHGLVGRYFSGHVTYRVPRTQGGTSVFFSRGPANLDLYASRDRSEVWGVLATSREAQRREELPNFTTTLNPPPSSIDARDAAVMGLATLADDELSELPPSSVMRRRFLPVYFMCEQAPNPESRITLSEDRDELGMRRVDLSWSYSADDFAGMRRSIEFLRKELGRAGVGRVQYAGGPGDYLARFNASRHHIGSTRMHRQPQRGVVDADCRVHGVRNLYTAGSSVFPTGGIANPTLTILALAARLSDHLERELGG